jgi:hypothetical protein
VDGDAEAQTLSAGSFCPTTDDIFLWPNVDRIPRVVPGIPRIKVAVVVPQGGKVFTPGAFVNNASGSQFSAPKIADILISEF